MQGPSGDKAGPKGGPHAPTTDMQVKAVAIVQGGQGGRQARRLARKRALHQRHSNLPALLYLGAQGPKRPMRGIMEHARGWCK